VLNQKPLAGDLLDYGNPLAQGLVSLWPFNEDPGNKVFDLVGNNVGTFAGTAPSWSAGKFGSAVRLPGTNEYVNCGDMSEVEGIDSFTIIVGFSTKAQTDGQFHGIVNKGEYYATGDSFAITIYGDTGANKIRTSIGTDIYGIPTMSALVQDQHYQFAWAYDKGSSTYNLYLDGTALAVTPTGSFVTLPDVVESVTFGKGRFYHNGLIDYVMIWNRTLSASEISQLYYEPFSMFKRRRRIIYDEIAAVGVAPTGVLDGCLVGCLGGPI